MVRRNWFGVVALMALAVAVLVVGCGSHSVGAPPATPKPPTPPPAPTVTLTANPSVFPPPASFVSPAPKTIITWSVQNAQRICAPTNFEAAPGLMSTWPMSGSAVVIVVGLYRSGDTAEFYMTAIGPGGTTTGRCFVLCQ